MPWVDVVGLEVGEPGLAGAGVIGVRPSEAEWHIPLLKEGKHLLTPVVRSVVQQDDVTSSPTTVILI